MNWKVKAVVQKLISFAPYSHILNYQLQKHVTKGVCLNKQYFDDKYAHAQNHVNYARKHCAHLEKTVLEIGTGWYPIVPIHCFLAGASKIYTYDIRPLVSQANFKKTIAYFMKVLEGETGSLLNREDLVESRVEELKAIHQNAGDFGDNPAELAQALNMELLVGDALNEGAISQKLDIILSNNVLEHIKPHYLHPLFRSLNTLSAPTCLHSHFIDMSDHFAHRDSSITDYNFLKFSERTWERIDNSLQPQNRWREKDYLQFFEKQKLAILEVEHRPGDEEQLSKVRVHSQVKKNYAPRELAITHTHLVARYSQ